MRFLRTISFVCPICVAMMFASCKSSSDTVNAVPPGAIFVMIDQYTHLPIPGVTVTMSSTIPAWSKQSDANGMVVYDNNAFGNDMIFHFTKAPYMTQEIGITLTENTTLHDTIYMVNPDNFLVAYWAFSNNTIDSSANHNDGTNHGCTFTTDRNGNPMSALSCNGTTNYVSIPSAESLNFGSTTDFSISAWYNVSDNQPVEFAYFVSKSTPSPFTGYALGMDNSVLTGHFGTSTSESFEVAFSGLSPDSRWHHAVAVVKRSSGECDLYLDGMLQQEVSPYGAKITGNINTAADLLIGGTGSASSAFKGSIDDVRIYSTAIDTATISKLFHE